MNVLIVDSNATRKDFLDSSIYRTTWAFFDRIGATITERYWSDITSEDNATAWDLVVFPWCVSTGGTAYTNLQTVLTGITANPPAVCLHASNPSNSSAGRSVTGTASPVGTLGEKICTVFDWQDRAVSRMSFYGYNVNLDGASGTNPLPRMETAGGDVAVWSNTVGGSDMLWICGYNDSITNTTAEMWKPDLAAQWAVDHGARCVTKATVLMRVDGGDDDNSITGYNSGDWDNFYDACVAAGLPEIHLAVVGQGSYLPFANPNDTDDALKNWLVARDISNGGLLRAHNHHTDIVDGASTRCSSNGLLYDLVPQALSAYNTACDAITGAGMTCGADGYGAGIPNCQNANDMTVPAAKLLGTLGAYPWIAFGEQYPNAAAWPTLTSGLDMWDYNFWYSTRSVEIEGAKCILSISIDNATAAGYPSLTFNESFLRMAIAGGGLYVHPSTTSRGFWYQTTPGDNLGWYPEYLGRFKACPDILDARWSSLKAWLG